ncbi:DUF2505 domain-containing protein [Knoellia sp. CPCC 206450]|uniref:DUF2505 domain-containing protein n=1 Tax=Knoellia tibetensis TaxID=3404798 RepID=UPI003B43BBBE
MKFTHRAEYPAAPDVVFAQMCEQEFQDAKCDATTTGTWKAGVSSTGDRTVISTERVLPTDGLPDIARSFVGETLTVVEVQTWGPAAADGTRTGDLNLHVKGAPMTLKGAVRLSPSASGTVHELAGELKAGVPLIGGKLEKAAADPLLHAARTETDLLRRRVG